jgi:hypothetical protein
MDINYNNIVGDFFLLIGCVVGVIAVVLFGISTLAFSVAVLVGPVMLLPANWILALAVGADVIRYHGLMQIECEPVPGGFTGTVSTVRYQMTSTKDWVSFTSFTRPNRLAPRSERFWSADELGCLGHLGHRNRFQGYQRWLR